jgi:hypothetical protein
MSTTSPESPASSGTRSLPHTQVTKYDIASAALIAGVGVTCITLLTLIAIWLANLRPPSVKLEPMLMAAGDGGWEDGDPDETLDVESPEDPTDDPSLANDQADVTEIMEITEPIVEFAETAAQIVEPNDFSDATDSGNPGSAEGTGGRPLGSGGPGRGGAKRENRWYVQFADRGNLQSYAEQLDFFGIELGALFLAQERLVYMKNMGAPRPQTREVKTGDDEKRLYMNWQGGDRIEADRELFGKAGIDAATASVLHFYPAATENAMARLEMDYAGRQPQEIRKTYYQVRKAGAGYEFYVTNQKLK